MPKVCKYLGTLDQSAIIVSIMNYPYGHLGRGMFPNGGGSELFK
jgi:hypothetical protein